MNYLVKDICCIIALDCGGEIFLNRVKLWILFLLAIAVLFTSISYSLVQPKHQRLLLSLYGLKQPAPKNIASPANPGNLVLITVDRLTLTDLLDDGDRKSVV